MWFRRGGAIGKVNRYRQVTRRYLLSGAAGVVLAKVPVARSAEVSGWPRGLDPKDMDLDAKLGQMLLMGFWGSEPSAPGVQSTTALLQSGTIGGVIFFEDNILQNSIQSLTRLFREAASPVIPFLGVDQEGGIVSRLRPDQGFEPLPSARAIAALGQNLALYYFDRTARELHSLGFNTNFAPVVDLLINADSAVIAQLGRSFSSNPSTVVEFAKLFIECHHRHNVLTAIKHFPGHGSTALDSHRALPDITDVWRPEELKPFAELISDRIVDMVMVGHLVHRDITGEGRPATLSARAIEGLLRGKLGYEGVVISDDMQMSALRNHFEADESIILGMDAGLDLFLFLNREHPDSEMPGRFFRVLRAAVRDRRISMDRIDQSVGRILALKRKLVA
jgi:beta-N-acetylhexosaminidase